MTGLLLGVDPGKDKTGVALVRENGELVAQTVLPTKQFLAFLADFLKDREMPQRCILGNGTTSETMKKTLVSAYPSLPITVVDEAHSTEEARTLYWQLYPPRGWKRLLPQGLRVPPGNLDGLAAVVLCRRYLARSQ
jgi:RNase H-fold protein (predicted Holliday junction resolvase)